VFFDDEVRRRAGRAWFVGVSALAAITFPATAQTAAASSDTAAVTLQYTCNYLGAHAMSAVVTWQVPPSWPVGKPSPQLPITVTATMDSGAAALLRLGGVASLQGTADADGDVVAPQGDLPEPVTLGVPRTPLGSSGPMVVPAGGSTPALTFSRPGSAKVTVGDVTLHLTGSNASGSASIPLNVPCSLNPGQSNVLASFQITSAPPAPPPSTNPTSGPPGPSTQPPTTAASSQRPPSTTPPATSRASSPPANQSTSPAGTTASASGAIGAPTGTDSASSDAPSTASTTSTPDQLTAKKAGGGMNTTAWTLLVVGVLAAGAASYGGAMWLKRRSDG
jgi:hypothetical protein